MSFSKKVTLIVILQNDAFLFAPPIPNHIRKGNKTKQDTYGKGVLGLKVVLRFQWFQQLRKFKIHLCVLVGFTSFSLAGKKKKLGFRLTGVRTFRTVPHFFIINSINFVESTSLNQGLTLHVLLAISMTKKCRNSVTAYENSHPHH